MSRGALKSFGPDADTGVLPLVRGTDGNHPRGPREFAAAGYKPAASHLLLRSLPSQLSALTSALLTTTWPSIELSTTATSFGRSRCPRPCRPHDKCSSAAALDSESRVAAPADPTNAGAATPKETRCLLPFAHRSGKPVLGRKATPAFLPQLGFWSLRDNSGCDRETADPGARRIRNVRP